MTAVWFPYLLNFVIPKRKDPILTLNNSLQNIFVKVWWICLHIKTIHFSGPSQNRENAEDVTECQSSKSGATEKDRLHCMIWARTLRFSFVPIALGTGPLYSRCCIQSHPATLCTKTPMYHNPSSAPITAFPIILYTKGVQPMAPGSFAWGLWTSEGATAMHSSHDGQHRQAWQIHVCRDAGDAVQPQQPWQPALTSQVNARLEGCRGCNVCISTSIWKCTLSASTLSASSSYHCR